MGFGSGGSGTAAKYCNRGTHLATDSTKPDSDQRMRLHQTLPPTVVVQKVAGLSVLLPSNHAT
jgi:hypothetical protein